MVDERSEIGDEYKWDIDDMYSSEDEWINEFERAKNRVEKLDELKKGNWIRLKT